MSTWIVVLFPGIPLQTVNKVQITVNGSADVTYRNVISLAQPLEREEKYIVK